MGTLETNLTLPLHPRTPSAPRAGSSLGAVTTHRFGNLLALCHSGPQGGSRLDSCFAVVPSQGAAPGAAPPRPALGLGPEALLAKGSAFCSSPSSQPPHQSPPGAQAGRPALCPIPVTSGKRPEPQFPHLCPGVDTAPSGVWSQCISLSGSQRRD